MSCFYCVCAIVKLENTQSWYLVRRCIAAAKGVGEATMIQTHTALNVNYQKCKLLFLYSTQKVKAS